MENQPKNTNDTNRGSAPIPSEAINRGDNQYDPQKAQDKDGLMNEINKNMATKEGKGSSKDKNQEDDDKLGQDHQPTQ